MSADDITLGGVTNTGREVEASFDLRQLGELQSGKRRFIAATGPAREQAEDRLGELRLRQGAIVARTDQLAAEHGLTPISLTKIGSEDA